MRLNRVGGWFYCQSAGHSQVNTEDGLALELDEDLLPAPGDADHAAIQEQLCKINVARLDNVGPQMPDGGDTLPDQVGGQCADDGFNFWQFRHCNYYFRGASIKMTNELEWLEYTGAESGLCCRARHASPL